MRISCLEIQKQAVKTPINRTSMEKEAGIVFAIDTSNVKTATGEPIYFVRVRIGSTAAKKAKLKAGDKVSLEVDVGKKLGFVVPHTEGWVLSGLKRGKDGDQPLQLRFTWHHPQPSISEPTLCKDAIALTGPEAGQLQFTFPEGTSFDKMAPQKSQANPDVNNDLISPYNRRLTDRQAGPQRTKYENRSHA